jgi:hypothetical protein
VCSSDLIDMLPDDVEEGTYQCFTIEADVPLPEDSEPIEARVVPQ